MRTLRLVAFVILVGSAGTVYVLIKRNKNPFAHPATQKAGSGRAYALVHDCPAGTVITDSLLTEVEASKPKGSSPKPATKDALLDGVLRVSLSAATPVQTTDLVGRLDTHAWPAATSPTRHLWWHPVAPELLPKMLAGVEVDVRSALTASRPPIVRRARVLQPQPRFLDTQGEDASPGVVVEVGTSDAEALAKAVQQIGEAMIVLSPALPVAVAPADKPVSVTPVAATALETSGGIAMDDVFPRELRQSEEDASWRQPPQARPPKPQTETDGAPGEQPGDQGGQEEDRWQETKRDVLVKQPVEIYTGSKRRVEELPSHYETVTEWVPVKGGVRPAAP